jgi:hypothetical protein
MKVKTIRIRDILCIDSLTISPGQLTVLEGPNATGKTSVLAAIRAVLSGGHDPSLIRRKNPDEFPPKPDPKKFEDQAAYQGELEAWQDEVKQPTSGEVILTLDDGIRIRKRITQRGSSYDITDNQGRKITRHREYIEGIFDSLSLDPVDFLTMDPKKRARLLLQMTDQKVSAEQLGAIYGKLAIDTPPPTIDVDSKASAIELLDGIDRGFREERTGLNRVAKEKQGTIAQLEDTVTDIVDKDWEAELQTLNAALANLVEQHENEKKAIFSDYQETLTSVDREFNKSVEDSRARAQEKIDAIKAEHDDNVAKFRATMERAKKEAGDLEESRVEELDSDYLPRRESVKSKIDHATAAREEQVRQQKTKEFLAQTERELNTLREKSDGYTAALKELEALRLKLISESPIEGLEIKDGDVYIDGVLFDRQNDARKYQISIQLAKLRAGELSLLLLDRAEIFDPDNWKLFTKIAIDSGLQVVAAKVSSDPTASGMTIEEVTDASAELQ